MTELTADELSTVETQISLVEMEQRILKLHRQYVASTGLLRAFVDEKSSETDPNGWRVYGYRASEVGPDQIDSSEDVQPAFELHFIPESAGGRDNLPSIVVLSAVNEREQQTQDGIMIGRVYLEYFPMASDRREFTSLTVELIDDSMPSDVIPVVISRVNEEGVEGMEFVSSEGISISKIEDAVQEAESVLRWANGIVDGIHNREFHLRIYGNSTVTQVMEPIVINQEV